MNLPELIEIARRNVIETDSCPVCIFRPASEYRNRLIPCVHDLIRERFEDLDPPVTDWRGWIYHVPMPKDMGVVRYVDTKIDPNRFDYDPIVAHAVKRGRAILVNELLYPFNPLEPMYERCRAMCAYVHSSAFNSPTVFLDGDAFVNADLTPIFKTIRDVAVTYRLDLGLMPINEGVIFAQPTEGTRAFFRAYLATYENLAKVPEIVEYYGDIKRWRGGQLSLNAIACPEGVPSEMDQVQVNGCWVKLLPCETWNYALAMDQQYSHAELDTKAVLHLKGPRKVMVDQIKAYQNGKK